MLMRRFRLLTPSSLRTVSRVWPTRADLDHARSRARAVQRRRRRALHHLDALDVQRRRGPPSSADVLARITPSTTNSGVLLRLMLVGVRSRMLMPAPGCAGGVMFTPEIGPGSRRDRVVRRRLQHSPLTRPTVNGDAPRRRRVRDARRHDLVQRERTRAQSDVRRHSPAVRDTNVLAFSRRRRSPGASPGACRGPAARSGSGTHHWRSSPKRRSCRQPSPAPRPAADPPRR
jgi:hypothetical protein